MNKLEVIAEKIKDADAVLIGASNGLSIAEGYNIFANDERFREVFGDFQKKYGIGSVLHGASLPLPEEEMWSYFSRFADNYSIDGDSSPLMQSLHEIVKDKPYFVVTSNVDSHFQKAGFNPENVLEIEGSIKEMQCANSCHDTIYPSEDAVKTMLEHEEGMTIPEEYLPKCPECGGPMRPHLLDNRTFLQDENYKRRYQNFNHFLEKYHGKKLLILELGIGALNQLIKAPLMQLTKDEPNAEYITFNKGEIYIRPDIQDKSLGVDGDLSQILPEILKILEDE